MAGEASCSASVTRLTLADQMSAVDSSNIRQLLEGGARRDSFTGLSLNALLAYDKLPPPVSPPSTPGLTLLDIIRSEEPKQADGYRDLIGNKDKNTWKNFRDRLRLKRAASAVCVPGSDILSPNTRTRGLSVRSSSVQFGSVLTRESTEEQSVNSVVVTTRPSPGSIEQFANSVDVNGPRPVESEAIPPVPLESLNEGQSGSVWLSTVLAEERQLSDREAMAVQESIEDGDSGGEQPARMSLMELLEETDRQMGLTGSRYKMEVRAGNGEDGEDGEVCLGSRIEHTCCVCMVRHKGAAFIPCGHTFCRMCSRELWVQRGNCPLCNNHIVEVLDIF